MIFSNQSRRLRALLAGLFLCAMAAHALPPDVEADRYMMAAAKALEARNFADALSALESAKQLPVQMPTNFQFHYARALNGTNRLTSANTALETYLNAFGKKARYYNEALDLLNTNQAQMKERDAKFTALHTERQAAAQKRDASIAACVSDFRRQNNVTQTRSEFVELRAENNRCWERCSRTHCNETKKPPFQQCDAMNGRTDAAERRWESAKSAAELSDSDVTQNCAKKWPAVVVPVRAAD